MVFTVLVELLPEAYEEEQRGTIDLLGRRTPASRPWVSAGLLASYAARRRGRRERSACLPVHRGAAAPVSGVVPHGVQKPYARPRRRTRARVRKGRSRLRCSVSAWFWPSYPRVAELPVLRPGDPRFVVFSFLDVAIRRMVVCSCLLLRKNLPSGFKKPCGHEFSGHPPNCPDAVESASEGPFSPVLVDRKDRVVAALRGL